MALSLCVCNVKCSWFLCRTQLWVQTGSFTHTSCVIRVFEPDSWTSVSHKHPFWLIILSTVNILQHPHSDTHTHSYTQTHTILLASCLLLCHHLSYCMLVKAAIYLKSYVSDCLLNKQLRNVHVGRHTPFQFMTTDTHLSSMGMDQLHICSTVWMSLLLLKMISLLLYGDTTCVLFACEYLI